MDKIVWWVRGYGPEGLDRVKAYFKGRWRKDNDNGRAGDVKLRPYELGPGEFTVTVNGHDEFQDEAGNKIYPN